MTPVLFRSYGFQPIAVFPTMPAPAGDLACATLTDGRLDWGTMSIAAGFYVSRTADRAEYEPLLYHLVSIGHHDLEIASQLRPQWRKIKCKGTRTSTNSPSAAAGSISPPVPSLAPPPC